MRTVSFMGRVLNHIPSCTPLLAAAALTGHMASPAFLGSQNLHTIFFAVSVLLPATIGMHLLLVLGRFDLSSGSTAAFAGMTAALCIVDPCPAWVGVIVGATTGLLVGLVNGSLIAHVRLDPLLVTLATMSAGRSLALAAHDGQIVAGLPTGYGALVNTRIAGVSLLIVLAMLVVIATALAFRHTVVVRRMYASGDNPVAATHAGVRVPRLEVVAYMLAGLGAAATGLIQTSRTLSASPLVFQWLSLDAIAACIIGGASLHGGRGTVIGTVLGLVTVVVARNLIVIANLPLYWQDLAVGVILLLAVLGRPAWGAAQTLIQRTLS